MNILDAAHKTVKSYPGGSESLAPRIGMSAAVLRSKVNPNTQTHHLTLAEASEIMGITGDDRMLHALAAEHGYVLHSVQCPASTSLVGTFLSLSVAKGRLSATMAEAFEDKRITRNEASLIDEEVSAIMALLVVISQQARAAAEQGTPA